MSVTNVKSRSSNSFANILSPPVSTLHVIRGTPTNISWGRQIIAGTTLILVGHPHNDYILDNAIG